LFCLLSFPSGFGGFRWVSLFSFFHIVSIEILFIAPLPSQVFFRFVLSELPFFAFFGTLLRQFLGSQIMSSPAQGLASSVSFTSESGRDLAACLTKIPQSFKFVLAPTRFVGARRG